MYNTIITMINLNTVIYLRASSYYYDMRSLMLQDPSLFVGTLRSNLDPFGVYEDSQLWNALDEVQ